MSDEPKRSRLWIGWALLAAIVLYILSVGPVWWLAFHYGKPSKHTFSAVYRPFVFVRKARPLRDVTDWYLRVWVPGD
jgi:hypothetical protein